MRSRTEVADMTQEIRRQLGPEPGEPGSYLARCRDCGDGFWKWRGGKPRYCELCAHRRQVDGTAGQVEKRGPAYEKSVLGALRYYRAEAERLGLTPDAK